MKAFESMALRTKFGSKGEEVVRELKTSHEELQFVLEHFHGVS
jgi:hypothetical protein